MTYRVKGLVPGPGGKPREADEHRVQIYLHQGYPREKPNCTMLTPAFHPNIGSFVCVADVWAAGEPLVDLIVHIGNMIQYRIYNVKSALNVDAAAWAVSNEKRLPIGNVDLYPPEPQIAVASAQGFVEAAAAADIEVTLVSRKGTEDDVEVVIHSQRDS